MTNSNDLNNLPIVFDDPTSQMVRWMQRQYPRFGVHDLKLIEHYPYLTDYEAGMHYDRGVIGPFIDFLVLMDVGCGWNLIPTDFESDEDAQAAKKVVDSMFQKMELDETMQRYSTFGEVFGRKCNIRTYNENGGFYYDEQDKITGIDAINPLTLDINSIELAVYDRTGTQDFVQNIFNPLITTTGPMKIPLSQERVDYNVRGNLLKHGPFGKSAIANCISDCRTAAAAPGLRLELMYKQANVYRHNVLDVEELLKAPMGKQTLSNWDLADKKLQEQVDVLRRQEESRKSIVSWSFLKPAEISSMSGKATDFAETEKNTYDVIALKMGIPLSLLYADAAQTVNRSSLETVLDGFIKRREMSGGRKDCRNLIAKYAQEVKTQEDITEGYFKVEFKPFLGKDLLEALGRMQTLWQMGAAGKTELRRSQDMSDEIDFGEEGESADYQDLPNGDFEIANSNPHLIGPENTVTKKQNLIKFKKSLESLELLKGVHIHG
jgi:hypothetical protein